VIAVAHDRASMRLAGPDAISINGIHADGGVWSAAPHVKCLSLFTHGMSAPVNSATCRNISISCAIRAMALRFGWSDFQTESSEIIFSHAMIGDRGHRVEIRFQAGHPNFARVGVVAVAMFEAEFQMMVRSCLKTNRASRGRQSPPSAGG
jgi:hypothetical protein